MTELVAEQKEILESELDLHSISHRIKLTKSSIAQLLGIDLLYQGPDQTISSLEKYRLEEEKKQSYTFIA